jgi:hypothetical protein
VALLLAVQQLLDLLDLEVDKLRVFFNGLLYLPAFLALKGDEPEQPRIARIFTNGVEMGVGESRSTIGPTPASLGTPHWCNAWQFPAPAPAPTRFDALKRAGATREYTGCRRFGMGEG